MQENQQWQEHNMWIKTITDEELLKYQGFVYLITNLVTGEKYIGKKFLYSRRTVVLKGKKKKTTKESDWKDYYGSSEYLQKDIDLLGKDKFKREILSYHKTRSATNYAELEQQVLNDVLRDPMFYNRNIANKYYKSNI